MSGTLRFQVKARFERAPEPDALVREWHRWIRDGVREQDALLDVADYTHMHEGPWVLLVAHRCDYAFDVDAFGHGLQVSLKRDIDAEDPEGQLRAAVSRLADAALKLEQLETPKGSVRVSPAHLRLRLNDRLPLKDPGGAKTLAAIETAWSATLGSAFSCQRQEGDPRKLPVWLAEAATPPSWTDLRGN